MVFKVSIFHSTGIIGSAVFLAHTIYMGIKKYKIKSIEGEAIDLFTEG